MARTITELGSAQARHAVPSRLLQATVRGEPATDADPLMVRIDSQPVASLALRPAVGWAPHGEDWPTVGARVWVQESDRGQLVVMAWTPA